MKKFRVMIEELKEFHPIGDAESYTTGKLIELKAFSTQIEADNFAKQLQQDWDDFHDCAYKSYRQNDSAFDLCVENHLEKYPFYNTMRECSCCNYKANIIVKYI